MDSATWAFIISQGETQHYDLKGPMLWDKSSRPDLLKDLAALANTQDGGALIIGVEDVSHKVLGLSAPQLSSFDPTKIGQAVQKHFSPAFGVGVEKPVLDGKTLACLVVKEFEPDPVICQLEIQDSQQVSVVKAGAVLVRTLQAQSQVCGPVEMHALLGRAILKRRNELLDQIRQLVGAPAVTTSSVPPSWAKERLENWIEFSTIGGKPRESK